MNIFNFSSYSPMLYILTVVSKSIHFLILLTNYIILPKCIIFAHLMSGKVILVIRMHFSGQAEYFFPLFMFSYVWSFTFPFLFLFFAHFYCLSFSYRLLLVLYVLDTNPLCILLTNVSSNLCFIWVFLYCPVFKSFSFDVIKFLFGFWLLKEKSYLKCFFYHQKNI